MDDLRTANRLDIAATAALLAEPTRVAMVSALMDGQARPATELAHIAGVSASTGSAHLGLLVRGGLLRVEQHGRHRYHRLASDAAGRAFESLSVLAARPRRQPAPEDPARAAFRRARTCYRHLAGELGVALVDRLLGRRWMRRDSGRFVLTGPGERELQSLGLLEPQPERLHGTPCLDWTERRDHVAGPLGVGLAYGLLQAGWLRTRPGTRALRVTVEGARAFRDALDLSTVAG
jgi:DNA-binding transcriptional ArsR family regulator